MAGVFRGFPVERIAAADARESKQVQAVLDTVVSAIAAHLKRTLALRVRLAVDSTEVLLRGRAHVATDR